MLIRLKNFFRESNFLARVFTFGMIPLFFRIFCFIAKWVYKEPATMEFKLLGITGILIGSWIGHILYYYWIFPEKCKNKPNNI